MGVGDVLRGGDAGDTIWIVDMGDDPLHGLGYPDG